jgi:predicted permease
VVRQLLTESAVLAVLGAAAGLLVAAWGVDLCAAILPPASVFQVGLDGRVVAFALVVAVASVLLFGLVPALRASGADVQRGLRDGTRSVAGGRARLKNALVVGQVALSFALLVGAALLGRSFLTLAAVDPGFDPSHVVTLQIALPAGKDPAPYYRRLLEEVEATPGVAAAGVVDFLPLSQNNMNGDFQIEGRPFPPDAHPVTEFMVASPRYFDTMGMRIVAGRGLAAADRDGARRVVVINQRMAKRYFPDENPIGKRLRWGGDGDGDEWAEIVGVVNDVKRWSLADDAAQPETWKPFAQAPFRNMALAVRGAGDPALLADAVRRAVTRIDPEQAVFAVATMSHLLDDTLRGRRLVMTFLSVFAGIALGLAAIGLYGVLAVQVAQRTRELGIRMALGARPSSVRALVVGHGLRLALVGVLVGAGAALLLGRVLAQLLYGVSATDPWTFVGVGAGLVVVALVATWLPARRATRIDPMIALRS